MTVLAERIYLDYNASAPLLPEARAALMNASALVGNPSSVHAEGRASRAAVADARRRVAALAGAEPEGVVFTGGATEAAATCLTPDWVLGGREIRLPRLAVLDTDHPCLREGGRFAPDAVTRLPVEPTGLVDLDALASWLAAGEPGLVAFTAGNSETGVVQPVAEIVSRVKAAGALAVVDAVQMATRLPIDVAAWNADAMVLSGHKIGAPKGVGAFVLGSVDRRPIPLMTGGAQETRQRAGTEAVGLVAAFGAAAEAGRARLGEDGARFRALRDRLLAGLAGIGGELVVLGEGAPCLPQTVAVQHRLLRAETVQIALDLAGIAVSAGSACSSGKLGASHVLAAMSRAGAPIDPDRGAIRISFGRGTTAGEIDAFLAAFAGQVAKAETGGAKRNAA